MITKLEQAFIKHHNMCQICKSPDTWWQWVEIDADWNFCDRTNNPVVDVIQMRQCSCWYRFTPKSLTKENLDKFRYFNNITL